MSKDHIVYLGVSGFPFGLAAISRQKLVARGLIHAGADVTVICARSVHKEGVDIRKVGVYEGVPYRYAVSPFRDKNFFVRNVKRKLDWLFELYDLIKLNNQKKITHVIVSNTNVFSYAVWIKLISVFFRFKVVLSLVEIYKGRKGQRTLVKLNNYLFNHFGLYFFHGFLPISHQLETHFEKFGIPSLYFPILVDVDKFQNLETPQLTHTNFVFCGAAGYRKTIEFVIQSFERMKHQEATLTLVAGGSKEEISLILEMIKQSARSKDIIHRMNLSDKELYSLYIESHALLIPLFDTIQDQARFPHKLGEYLASGTCVITNKVGDLQYYLEHNKTALIAKPDNLDEFASLMDEVILFPEIAEQIGKNGLEVCKNNFEYRKLGVACLEFFDQLRC